MTMKIKFLLLSAITLFFYISTHAQEKTSVISGIVLDENDKPIPGVNVFISGTTLGTSSDVDGRFSFSIKNMLNDQYELIFSNIAYKAFKYRFRTPLPDNKLALKVAMEKKVQNLKAINVVGERPKNWSKNLSLFKKSLIGASANAYETTLLNPEVLTFERQGKRLIAKAEQDLRLRNKRLCYDLTVNLRIFNWSLKKDEGGFLFNYINFRSIQNQKEQTSYVKKTASRRLETYKRSKRRFFKLLNQNKDIDDYDYNIRKNKIELFAQRDSISYLELKEMGATELFEQTYRNMYIYNLKKARKPLKVSYKSFPSELKTIEGRPIVVDANGNILNAADVAISGYWARQRTADMLPSNYAPLGN